jgi:hypothetical protein
MLSQYLTIGHMAKAHRENPRHLARITLRMEDTIKLKLLPTIRPVCHHQSTRHSKSLKEELSYMGTKARGDEAMMRSAETNRHNEKLAMMADPGKGNKLDMMMARSTAATKTKIVHHAATMASRCHDENQKDPAPCRAAGSHCSC